jgi:hypothetical protein
MIQKGNEKYASQHAISQKLHEMTAGEFRHPRTKLDPRIHEMLLKEIMINGGAPSLSEISNYARKTTNSETMEKAS